MALPRKLLPLSLALVSLAAAGCGLDGYPPPGPGPIPPPLPPGPPSNSCQGLNEQACLSAPGCEPTYFEVACLAIWCDPSQGAPCPACQKSYAGCQPPPPPSVCEGLDSSSCSATPGCEVITHCPLANDPSLRCATPCIETCQSKPTPPPPSRCAGLDEQACMGTPGCEPLFGGACPGCPPGMACPMNCPGQYLGCGELPPPPPIKCEGLDEQTCNAHPDCEPYFGGACPSCAPGMLCPPCGSGYLGCGPIQLPPPPHRCAGLDEQSCNQTSGCLGVYGSCPPNALCDCSPDGDCYTNSFAFCTEDLGIESPGSTGGEEEESPPPAQ